MKRGSHGPAGGHDDRRLDGDLADRDVGGVEHEVFPLEDGEGVGGLDVDDVVEVRVQRADAGRDIDLELVKVYIVAAPRNGLPVCSEDEAGDVIGCVLGGVVAGDPGRCGQGEGAGLYGKIDLGVEELARRVGEVRCDLDRRLLGKRRSSDEKGQSEREAAAGHGEDVLFVWEDSTSIGASRPRQCWVWRVCSIT